MLVAIPDVAAQLSAGCYGPWTTTSDTCTWLPDSCTAGLPGSPCTCPPPIIGTEGSGAQRLEHEPFCWSCGCSQDEYLDVLTPEDVTTSGNCLVCMSCREGYTSPGGSATQCTEIPDELEDQVVEHVQGAVEDRASEIVEQDLEDTRNGQEGSRDRHSDDPDAHEETRNARTRDVGAYGDMESNGGKTRQPWAKELVGGLFAATVACLLSILSCCCSSDVEEDADPVKDPENIPVAAPRPDSDAVNNPLAATRTEL